MKYNKLVFAGPVGAGKSTAIQSISSSAPVSTDVPLSSGPMGEKTTTTVALDYSFLNLNGDILHIYGLPGQGRLSFMRDIVLDGALGVILLLDGSTPDIYDNAHHWLSSIKEINESVNFVIGITKSDIASELSLTELRNVVGQFAPTAPILSVDAREQNDIKQLLQILVAIHH